MWTRHVSLWQTKHSASVSQWYPCGRSLCWGSDLHRQKSYQNAQQQSDPPNPQPPEQQNGNSVTFSQSSLQLSDIKWFRWEQKMIPVASGSFSHYCVSWFYHGFKHRRLQMTWLTLLKTVWDLRTGCQMKVRGVQHRRWEGVYAWGFVKVTGTFTNEETLRVSVGMQPYITSRWQWLAGPALVANWC